MTTRQAGILRDLAVVIAIFIAATIAVYNKAHTEANLLALVGLYYMALSLHSRSK